jgi:phosphoribosyl 1,2-cyclic phosphodiesterase
VKVVLHGVRGSSAAPGPAFLRVGGHTSCVAVTPSGRDVPTLLLDAGTGLVSVSGSLNGAAYRGDILLTHLHWDHVQGLPFFAAGDRDDSVVRLLLPAQGEAVPNRPDSAAKLLSRAMSPPHFPIGPEGLRGSWTFEAVEAGQLFVGGFDVTALEVPHKGGRTFGYRVEGDGASFAYLPDHDLAVTSAAGFELADGVDVLLHGAMFADTEREIAHLYGHAIVGDVQQLATKAKVRRLVLIHHAPQRTDDQVADLAASLLEVGPEVVIGREGDVVLDSS